jgi:hypothetical protein
MGNLRALRALRADGTESPIEASISTTKAGGHTIYTVILRDITARQTAEDALRATEFCAALDFYAAHASGRGRR